MLSILVSSCKNIFIPIILRTCRLEIFVMCATGCIYHVFKCIRDICDSVKFFLWCDAFVSALGCSGCLWPVRGTGLTGLSRVVCWLVWTGLTGPCDRSDWSVAAALSSCLLVWITCHIASQVILRCSHALVAPHGCWDLGGVSFVLNMCNLACEANLS